LLVTARGLRSATASLMQSPHLMMETMDEHNQEKRHHNG
jgi:hypothetical protein